jgi:hypothetical protein
VLTLKPWRTRHLRRRLAHKLNRELSTITGARVHGQRRGAFQRGGGGRGGNSVEMIVTGRVGL